MTILRLGRLETLRLPTPDPSASPHEASDELLHLRDRLHHDHDRDIDPYAARGAAIETEPMP